MRLAEIFIESFHDVDIRILNDVGRVNARLDAPVEAHLHHVAQTITMAREDLI
jgi:hypothetical protein